MTLVRGGESVLAAGVPHSVSPWVISLCDLLHSVVKYVATQGTLVVRSKRNPLFSSVSVYELVKAPKWGGGGKKKITQTKWKTTLDFSFHWESETVIANKPYFITGFLGDNVVKKKYTGWYCVLSSCLASERVSRLLESPPLNVLAPADRLCWVPTRHTGESLSCCGLGVFLVSIELPWHLNPEQDSIGVICLSQCL